MRILGKRGSVSRFRTPAAAGSNCDLRSVLRAGRELGWAGISKSAERRWYGGWALTREWADFLARVLNSGKSEQIRIRRDAPGKGTIGRGEN